MTNPRSEIRKAEKVVNEIRAIRSRLWKDADCDVDVFLRQLNQDVPWNEVKGESAKKKAKSKTTKPPRARTRGR